MSLGERYTPAIDKKETLSRNLGAVLIKPDAVELGIAEELIAHITQQLHEAGCAQLVSVHMTTLTQTDISNIYQNIIHKIGPVLYDYLMTAPSIIVTFRGNGYQDVLAVLNRLKGSSLKSRTSVQQNKGLQDGIRDIIPVPGTTAAFAPILQKVCMGDTRFTDEEFGIYCQNLLHVPDNYPELRALVNVLPPDELRHNLFSTDQAITTTEHEAGNQPTFDLRAVAKQAHFELYGDHCVFAQSFSATGFVQQSLEGPVFIKRITRFDKASQSQIEPLAAQLAYEYGLLTPLIFAFVHASELDSAAGYVIQEFVQARSVDEYATEYWPVAQVRRLAEHISQQVAQLHQLKAHAVLENQPEYLEIPGLETNHFDETAAEITAAPESFLSTAQKEAALAALERTTEALVFTHQDLYPGNFLVDSQLNLQAIIDWEKAEWAPVGKDFFGLYCTYMALRYDFNCFIDSYIQYSGMKRTAVVDQLKSYGLYKAIKVYTFGDKKNLDWLRQWARSYRDFVDALPHLP